MLIFHASCKNPTGVIANGHLLPERCLRASDKTFSATHYTYCVSKMRMCQKCEPEIRLIFVFK